MSEHTPWQQNPTNQYEVIRADSRPIALCVHKDDAARIVREHAAHDDLLEACRLVAGHDYDEPVGRTAILAAEAAFAKATT